MQDLAGTGTQGFSGDGGQTLSANLNSPTGIGLDAAGNIYFADSANFRIRRIDVNTGIISTVAGIGGNLTGTTDYGDGRPATSAIFYYPESATVDPAGNIYVADYAHNEVRKIDGKTGIITNVAGRLLSLAASPAIIV